jgi:tRNA pseudouridine55 synthase
MGMERADGIREPCSACPGGRVPPRLGSETRARLAPAGILNLNKPSGPTSHDVVARIRRASGVRRVGHAGTLDPAASGVLVVCLGQATRVVEYLVSSKKRYEATVRLGITTETGDAQGRVIRSISEIHTSRAQVERALSRFRGRVEQVPPMYSALKHEGKALYELARRGIEVERSPRVVEIHHLRLTGWTPPTFRILVECSKGTYVRVLAADLGEVLGTGGHLEQLVRVACGHYTLEDAVSLDHAEQVLSGGDWSQILHPLDEPLLDLEAFTVGQETETRIRQGQEVAGPGPSRGLLSRAYSTTGQFVGLLQYHQENRTWQPRKVFNADEVSA